MQEKEFFLDGCPFVIVIFHATKDELNQQKLHGSKEVQGVMCANSIFAECLIIYVKSSLT